MRSALGKEPVTFHAPHTGLSPTERLIVGFDDGTSVFVKAATDDATAAALRIENEILASISDDFVSRRLAWFDGERPVLLVEDLSAAHWPADHYPVTWKPGQHELLFAALRRVAKTAPPSSLHAAEEGFEPCWPAITADAEGFLALGLCSEAWFRDAQETLIVAEAEVPLTGDALVHHDVRSDNLCFVGDRVVLVDWAEARRGHPDHDLATVLPTLALEGGPDPYDVMPEGGAWAAYQAGLLLRRVLRASDAPGAASAGPPWLRKILLRLTAICLAWAARSLGQAQPDGRSWREIG